MFHERFEKPYANALKLLSLGYPDLLEQFQLLLPIKHPPAAGHAMNAFPWQQDDVVVNGAP